MVDIEGAVIAYLGDALSLDDCTVYAEVPNPRPEKFVTVERTGGSDLEKFVDQPTLAVQSWAPTRYEASELARDVDALLLDMPGEVINVMGCDRNSLYNFPDPDSRQARYQGVYDLVVN